MAIKEGAAAVGIIITAIVLGMAWQASYADSIPRSLSSAVPLSGGTSSLSIAKPSGRF